MESYELENGRVVIERINGLDVYDGDAFVCEIQGKTLDSFRDENDEIDEDALDAEIDDILDADEFIDYQKNYC